jgi:DNA replication protein DnaC
MAVHALPAPSIIERIKTTLFGLRISRALEIVDVIVRQLKRGEATALEAINTLPVKELTLCENRRIKTALVMARLSAIKTLAGFDFTFQPSLDRGRIMALAELKFIDRSEAAHFVGPPGAGKSHPGVALGVEAVKAGRSVHFITLADLVDALARAEREGSLRQKIRFFCRFARLIVDEIGYLPVVPSGGNLFFQLANARYERGAMILTSNRGLPNGARFSAIPWSPPRGSIGCFTPPLLFKSKVPATGCANTPTWFRSTSGPKRSSIRRRRWSSHRRSVAADPPKPLPSPPAAPKPEASPPECPCNCVTQRRTVHAKRPQTRRRAAAQQCRTTGALPRSSAGARTASRDAPPSAGRPPHSPSTLARRRRRTNRPTGRICCLVRRLARKPARQPHCRGTPGYRRSRPR